MAVSPRARSSASRPSFAASGWILGLTPQQRRELCDNAIAALVRVHQVDWRGGGLDWLHRRGDGTSTERELAYYEHFYRWAAEGLTVPVIEAGLAVDVYALRVNFIGELGWELHFPIEYAHHLFDALFDTGEEFGIGMVGMRAMESLRLEKSYRMWGSDMTRDYTPFEAGLDRFVRIDKGEFNGRDALKKQLSAGVPNRFVTVEVHGVTDADPLGNEPLFDEQGSMIGRATSGYYGHVLKKSLAIGYVQPAFATAGTRLQIEILGRVRREAVRRDPRGGGPIEAPA